MGLNYELIGRRLKEARITKKYTQENLSEMLDISVAYLSKIENGKVKLSLKRLNELCTLLNVSMGSILDGSSNDMADMYLNKELNSILQACSIKAKEQIYEISTIIKNNDNN